MTKMKRTYTELSKLKTFEERFNYLKLDGTVAVDTFGSNRYLNQQFYSSKEWKDVRRKVILRDSDLTNCFDLGDPNTPINGKVMIHHMNPIEVKDISDYSTILNPEYLICVSHETHNALHYGNDDICKAKQIIERTPNDTCPWKGI